jgi:hypothetical protein
LLISSYASPAAAPEVNISGSFDIVLLSYSLATRSRNYVVSFGGSGADLGFDLTFEPVTNRVVIAGGTSSVGWPSANFTTTDYDVVVVVVHVATGVVSFIKRFGTIPDGNDLGYLALLDPQRDSLITLWYNDVILQTDQNVFDGFYSTGYVTGKSFQITRSKIPSDQAEAIRPSAWSATVRVREGVLVVSSFGSILLFVSFSFPSFFLCVSQYAAHQSFICYSNSLTLHPDTGAVFALCNADDYTFMQRYPTDFDEYNRVRVSDDFPNYGGMVSNADGTYAQNGLLFMMDTCWNGGVLSADNSSCVCPSPGPCFLLGLWSHLTSSFPLFLFPLLFVSFVPFL